MKIYREFYDYTISVEGDGCVHISQYDPADGTIDVVTLMPEQWHIFVKDIDEIDHHLKSKGVEPCHASDR